MTPLLITTSAHPSSTGKRSARPSRNSTWASLELRDRSAGLGEHFFRHVDADDSSGRTHLMGRHEKIETGARSHIDNLLAFGKRS